MYGFIVIILLNFFMYSCSSESIDIQKMHMNGPWVTDYPKVLEKARIENKPIFLYIGGSDWCPPCILFRQDVLYQSSFISQFQDRIILVDVDLPMIGETQEVSLRIQNKKLISEFSIESYPTVVLINAEEEEIASRFQGYNGDVKDQFIHYLEVAIEEAGYYK